MARKTVEINIDDFYPVNDGFSQSYKGTWREQSMIATAWLEPAGRGRFPRGVYLRGAYELRSTYGNSRHSTLSTSQEEMGADLARKLRERMQEEMRSAGWEVVAQSTAGLNLWQYRPARTAAARPAPATGDQGKEKRGKGRKKYEPVQAIEPARRSVSIPAREKVKAYERIVTQQMTFPCKECGKETTRYVYPGGVKYCEPCAKEVERKKRNERRMRSYYAEKARKKGDVKPAK